MYLHALLDYLVDWDQILRYGWNVQDIPNACVFVVFAKLTIVDVPNGMYGVVSCLHVGGSIWHS